MSEPDAIPTAIPDPTPDPTPAADLAAKHPCFSQDAHQYYARIHLPVAPGCNIQCNYCNRRFDCANESRPGVTSALLTPREALERVQRAASHLGHLSVVGIAGPGEPLANARRTFATLALVREHCPDLHLCLSTNGLALLDHLDRIVDLNIKHVTITINMTDPRVGAKIYPWITYRGRRHTGHEGARILTQRQLEGLRALREHGILCKVNSVLIPGVNDEHLPEVARTVADLGAFLHNVMPLISKPQHGTHFGLTGQREPTPDELWRMRERLERTGAGNVTMMRHCRQCRADALGLPGQDASVLPDQRPDPEAGVSPISPSAGESGPYDLSARRLVHDGIERWRAGVVAARRERGITVGPNRACPRSQGGQRIRPVQGTETPGPGTVLVAVATTGGGVVNQHFGRATEFWIYEAAPDLARFIGIRQVPQRCGGPDQCGEPSVALDQIVELLRDCSAVLCSKIGPSSHGALVAAGIRPMEVHDLIEQAVAAVGEALDSTDRTADVLSQLT